VGRPDLYPGPGGLGLGDLPLPRQGARACLLLPWKQQDGSHLDQRHVAAFWGPGGIWAAVHLAKAPADAIKVEVLGKQFAWSFRYAGPDGKFGRTDIKLINDAGGNPFGIDDKDPAGNDDIVSSTLHVPAGTPVALTLKSRDVIHSFFVRELRLKQDLVPGMEIPLYFQADKIGSYELACAELCGLGHHQMRSSLEVMSAADFEKWKRQQAAQR
jgi:cytochrome c oxidase subunit 2